MLKRKYWFGPRLEYVAPEPFWKSLLKYRAELDRVYLEEERIPGANLISSNVEGTRSQQMPIIDLDVPHLYTETSEGHAHLYLNTPTTRWRWWVLMTGLYLTGNIEKGFFYWSMRRGANFVRPVGVRKDQDV